MLALYKILSVKLHFNDTPCGLNDVCGSSAIHIRITHSLAQNAGSLHCSQVLQCSLGQVPFSQLKSESTWALPTSCVNYHGAKIIYLTNHFPACSKGPIHIASGLSLNHHLRYISGLSQWPVLSHTCETYHLYPYGSRDHTVKSCSSKTGTVEKCQALLWT